MMKFSGQNCLMQIRQGDIEVETQMGEHYDRFTQYVWETVREVVPPKKKQKLNGSTITVKKRAFYL